MSHEFRSIVSRGEAEGELMEAAKDSDGNFVLFDPKKRRDGSVLTADYTPTRSAAEAKRLIEERGFSMRMRLQGSRSVPASMIQAKNIVIIDIAAEHQRRVATSNAAEARSA